MSASRAEASISFWGALFVGPTEPRGQRDSPLRSSLPPLEPRPGREGQGGEGAEEERGGALREEVRKKVEAKEEEKAKEALTAWLARQQAVTDEMFSMLGIGLFTPAQRAREAELIPKKRKRKKRRRRRTRGMSSFCRTCPCRRLRRRFLRRSTCSTSSWC